MSQTAKAKRKGSPATTTKLDLKKKAIPTHRNPLKDLNATTTRSKTTTFSSSSSSSSSSHNSNSSSLSNKAPRGCLGFFLPNSTSKTHHQPFNKTPKSAPISKHRSKPPNSHKTQTPSFLNKSENAKDSAFNEIQDTLHLKSSKFGSEPLQWPFARTSFDENLTPVVNKLGLEGNAEGESKLNTTPPVEVSISPEIQCGSSFTSTKSACYGAGHILSGVTDKRKCRPRGVLAVEKAKELGLFEDGLSVNGNSFQGFSTNKRVSLVPIPMEASMHWISPQSDQKEIPQSGSTPFPSPSSSSYSHGFSSDISGNTNNTSDTTDTTTKGAYMVTPSARLCFDALLGSEDLTPIEQKRYRFDSPESKISPSSEGDSLGSHNVICTPESASSLDDCMVGLSWFKHEGSMFDFDSMSNALPTLSLSPNTRASMHNPNDVLPLPGFSFQFTHPSKQSSNILNQTQLQKTSDDWGLDSFNASYRNSSMSQMKISWRDGLVSRMFEMDDLDCCRLLSDDEEEGVICKDDKNVIQDPIFSDNVTLTSNEDMSRQSKTEKQCKVKVIENSNSCAESISTYGTELFASSDSDWNMCYKNQLFQE